MSGNIIKHGIFHSSEINHVCDAPCPVRCILFKKKPPRNCICKLLKSSNGTFCRSSFWEPLAEIPSKSHRLDNSCTSPSAYIILRSFYSSIILPVCINARMLISRETNLTKYHAALTSNFSVFTSSKALLSNVVLHN